MSSLTSHQALELTASFVCAAARMRAGDGDFQRRANLCETASRVAFLKATILARDEESRPVFGQNFRRGIFAIA
jgi:hypothetical protein